MRTPPDQEPPFVPWRLRRRQRPLPTDPDEEAGLPGYIRASISAVGNLQEVIKRVGSAIIGGSFSGNARGLNALDFQTGRTTAAQVASGEEAIAIGSQNEAAGLAAIALGHGNTANTGSLLYSSVVVGRDNTADGENAVAVGADCRAVADRSVALGDTAHAEDALTLAVGTEAHASGTHGLAIGAAAEGGTAILYNYAAAIGSHAHAQGGHFAQAIGFYAHALAAGAQALGNLARARLANTTVISGVLVTRKAALTQDAHEDPLTAGWLPLRHGAGAIVTITSALLDLTTAAQVDITFPAGSLFYIRDFTLEVVTGTAVTGQPSVQAGTSAAPTTHLAATATTGLTTKGASCRYFPSNWNAGVTTLQGKVAAVATGTTLTARFTWSGCLIEDE